MKKIVLLIFALLPLFVVAQNNTKRVAILETVDKVGDVSLGVKNLLRQSITFGINRIPGYEGYNRVDMSQITGEQNFQRTGYVSDADIKKLGQMTGADYVLIAEATTYDATHILVFANLVDVETGRITNSSIPKVASTAPDKMYEDCAEVARSLLGVTSDNKSPISPQVTSQAEEFVINKKLLQERNFRFPSARQESIVTIKTSRGNVNITCSSESSELNNARCYGTTSDNDCYINGLALLKMEDNEWALGYIACGYLAYPYLKFRTDGKNYFVGVQEIKSSYGCAYHPNWDSSDSRAFCVDVKKIFGNDVTTVGFIKEITSGLANLPELERAFENFLKEGGAIHKIWYGDDD